jgi:predicted O-methyltransferase YrrM
MRSTVKQAVKRFIPRIVWDIVQDYQAKLKILRCDTESWMSSNIESMTFDSVDDQLMTRIEEIAMKTEKKGPLPLWKGYADVKNYPHAVGSDAARSSQEVRTHRPTGRFFTLLTMKRNPLIVVEFGTAFGMSGMYWLVGLEKNGRGHLYTFEPNEIWARIAHDNLAEISNRFTGTMGTFEDNFSIVEKTRQKYRHLFN